jgi:hypothetical protein
MAVTLLDNSSSNIISSNVTVVTVDNVGIYAGMLGASFTLGRFLGFVPWKVARNILGEKHALVLSLLMTGLTSLWIGLCTTFPGALVARLAQGVSNCISGSVKRAAINARYNDNLVSKRALIVIVGSDQSQKYEGNSRQKTTSKEVYYDYDSNPPEVLVLSVMWWGTALGPIVGGLLSDPGFLGSFFELDSDSSTWYASYPYLLSNGFSAMLCWLSMVCVAVFTTDLPPRNSGSTSTPVGEQRPLLAPPSTRSSSTDKTATRRLWESFWTLWRTNKDARYHLIAYWSFSFVAVCCDEALPLFLITSKESTGLGLSEGRVGLLLSSTGLIVAASHHAALDKVFDTENGARDGMYRVLTACALFGNVTAVLVPLSLLLNDYDYGGDGNYNESNNNNNKSVLLGLTKTSFLYLVFILAFLRGSASVYFSLIGMATGRTLRVVHKDEAARIMTIGALLVRSLAPIIAGGVLSHFMATKPSVVTNTASSPSPLHSSWMVWIVIGLVFGLAAATNTFFLAAKQSGSGGMTENQRTYFANRLVRVRMRSLGSFYGSASKSICSRWNDCTSFVRLARKKAVTSGKRRNRTVVITSNNEPNEVVNKDAALIGKKQHTWKEHTVAPGVDFDIVSFFIIGTHKKDTRCVPHVLAPPIMDALQKNLPMNCSESNFWLKYSLIRDGASMHSIEAKSGLARNTILAIETLNGDVFGCFMTKVINILISSRVAIFVQCNLLLYLRHNFLVALMRILSFSKTSHGCQQTTTIEGPTNLFFGD